MNMNCEVTLILKMKYPVSSEVEASDIAKDMIDYWGTYLVSRGLELVVDEAREVDQ
jgi:hypothetical protein